MDVSRHPLAFLHEPGRRQKFLRAFIEAIFCLPAKRRRLSLQGGTIVLKTEGVCLESKRRRGKAMKRISMGLIVTLFISLISPVAEAQL